MADPDTDAAIAALWPARWEYANGARRGASKKRTKLRKQYRKHLLVTQLRSEGARCSNCLSFGMTNYPHSCSLYSDFHNVAMVDPDGICHHWRARPTLKKEK